MDAAIARYHRYEPESLALQSIRKIRQALQRGCSEKWLQNEQFINIMCYFLQCVGREELQLEAAWIFTNIAAGPDEQTKLIVDRGVIQLTLNLFTSPSDELVEQALWTIGNIVGDNPQYRDVVINHGLIDHLIALNCHTKPIGFLRIEVWVIVNLVRCKDPQISLENVRKIIPRINELVASNDSTVKIAALWALIYIADCNEEYIQTVVDSGIVAIVVPLLSSYRYRIMLAAMRMLGNISTGTDAQTQALLVSGILIHIQFPLSHQKEDLRRTALWCLSNITAGSQEQVKAVFQSGMLGRIVADLSFPDTCRLALFTVYNLILRGSMDQVLDIVKVGAVERLAQIMTVNSVHDVEMAALATYALNTVFKNQQLRTRYAKIYEQLIATP